MKNLISKRLVLPLALVSAVLPVVLLGCGGGSGTNPQKTQTGPQTIALAPATFALANGQRVTLTGARTGTDLKGNLKVEAAPLARTQSGAQNATFPFQIAVGNYGFTGTFTPPRGFSINGDFSTVGSFQMTGQLETQTEDGSYSLTTNGVTDNGIIPALNSNPTPNQTATPTPPTTRTPVPTLTPFMGGTPTPAPTPTAIPSEFQANAQFSARSSDLSASTFDIGATLVRGNADGEFYSAEFTQPLGGTIQSGNRTLSVSVVGRNKQPAVAGQSYTIPAEGNVIYKETSDGKTATWVSQSGTIQVSRYDSSGTTLNFANVPMKATPAVSTGFVSGSFNLTGQARGPLR